MADVPWWEPKTFDVALVTSLVSTACWGSWTNTAKASGDRVNFAHYYVDFCAGSLLGTVVLFLGPGMIKFGGQETESMRAVLALAAGVLFAVANLLLTTAIKLAGLSIAFPICIGTSLVLGTVLTYLVDRRGHPELIFTGLFLALCGILANAQAYGLKEAATVKQPQAESADEEDGGNPAAVTVQTPLSPSSARSGRSGRSGQSGHAGAVAPAAGAKEQPSKATAVVDAEAAGETSAESAENSAETSAEASTDEAAPSISRSKLLLLCIVGGVLMGSWSPLLAKSVARGPGLSPYMTEVCFTASSFVVSVAMIAGQQYGCQLIPRVDVATSLSEYFRLSPLLHGWGLLGGIIWAVGSVANLVGGGPLGFALSYALGQTAPVVAVLWGLLWYREFTGAPRGAWAWLLVMFVLFAAAITLLVLGGS